MSILGQEKPADAESEKIRAMLDIKPSDTEDDTEPEDSRQPNGHRTMAEAEVTDINKYRQSVNGMMNNIDVEALIMQGRTFVDVVIYGVKVAKVKTLTIEESKAMGMLYKDCETALDRDIVTGMYRTHSLYSGEDEILMPDKFDDRYSIMKTKSSDVLVKICDTCIRLDLAIDRLMNDKGDLPMEEMLKK